MTKESTRGYVDPATGIITGSGKGFSRWVAASNEKGQNSWKLRYANGTYVAGKTKTRTDGSTYEQVAWEQVNGEWYAFGADGFAKSGWVYDEALGGWFYLDENNRMKIGWHQINGIWYYFQTESDGRKGIMFSGRRTPDGYYVDKTGAWDGKGRS